jgi:hypothetical protein
MGTGNRPDLSLLQEFGATAWVKRLNTGKLDSRAEEGRFVGFDEESKGYRIYWPQKRRITVERDVYFNRTESLTPVNQEVQIEGEMEEHTNPEPPNTTSTPPAASYHPNTPQNDSITPNESPRDPNESNAPEDHQNPPQHTQNHLEPSQNAPEPPPHQRRARRDSLRGLPQFDEALYGRGRRRQAASSSDTATYANNAKGAENAMVVETDYLLEPGGVGNEPGWFLEAMECAKYAMGAEEDEPTLQEAMRGDEKSDWRDAIEAELKQVEKLRTYDQCWLKGRRPSNG